MIRTWFDKDTGRAKHAGRPNNEVSQRLERLGYPSRPGNAFSGKQKLDLATGELVFDPVYDQREQDQQQRRQEARQAYQEIKTAIENDQFIDPAVKQAFIRVLKLFRYINKNIND